MENLIAEIFEKFLLLSILAVGMIVLAASCVLAIHGIKFLFKKYKNR